MKIVKIAENMEHGSSNEVLVLIVGVDDQQALNRFSRIIFFDLFSLNLKLLVLACNLSMTEINQQMLTAWTLLFSFQEGMKEIDARNVARLTCEA